MRVLAVSLLLACAAAADFSEMSRAPRFLDQFSSGFMMEDGARAAAAPECKTGLGWVYYNGHCYLFTRSFNKVGLRQSPPGFDKVQTVHLPLPFLTDK